MKFLNFLSNGQKLFFGDIFIIINTVLLSLVYVFGVGIVWLVSRILRKKFLDLYPEQIKTYWTKVEIPEDNIKNSLKQF